MTGKRKLPSVESAALVAARKLVEDADKEVARKKRKRRASRMQTPAGLKGGRQ